MNEKSKSFTLRCLHQKASFRQIVGLAAVKLESFVSSSFLLFVVSSPDSLHASRSFSGGKCLRSGVLRRTRCQTANNILERAKQQANPPWTTALAFEDCHYICTMFRTTSFISSLLLVLVAITIQPGNAELGCERLKLTMEYSQEDALKNFPKIVSDHCVGFVAKASMKSRLFFCL